MQSRTLERIRFVSRLSKGGSKIVIVIPKHVVEKHPELVRIRDEKIPVKVTLEPIDVNGTE